MDLFEAAGQGIGLALAAGMLAGAVSGAAERGEGELGPLSALLLTAAVVVGGFAFGASLATEDHPAWPGWPVGAVLAYLGFAVIRGLVAGAAARAGEQGSGGAIAGMAALAAFLVAGLSLAYGPLSLPVLAALAYLGLRRRRRADEKHAGLRSLR